MPICYNIPIDLAAEDRLYWENLLRESAAAYNECAIHLRVRGTKLDLKTVHDEVYAWLRKNHPTIPAQGVIKIYKDVMSALRSIKSNKQGNAETPRKTGLNMRLDKRLYDHLDRTGISLSGARRGRRVRVGFSLYPKAEEMFAKYTTCDPMMFLRDGRFYLAVPFNAPDIPTADDTCIGVDLGMKRLYVTSEGGAFRDAVYLDHRRKVRHLKKELRKKTTKSAKRKLRKLKRRERNLSKDMCQRAANTLLRGTKASVIVMEDLTKIKQSTSRTKEGFLRKRHNNAMSQVPFYEFKETLTYKALLVGKRVETVSPVYTSQINSRSGKKDGIRKGCRYYCPDGVVLDADWNASVNIGRRSKHPVSCLPPIDGRLRFLTGRCPSTHQSRESYSTCKPLSL